MACPYFMPVEQVENGNWPHPRRLPLGCGWSGHCTAPGHEKSVPSHHVLETSCNLGYASTCDWAPADRPWDAVRFAIVAPKRTLPSAANSGPTQPAKVLCISYVCERDHRPAGQGELEFNLAAASWIRPHPDARVRKMAECFLHSYLKNKS